MLNKRNRAAALAAAPKQIQLSKSYRNKQDLSRGILNDSSKIPQYQWFTRLLTQAGKQAWEKGNLKLANYYAQLAANSTANPRGGIVR